MRIRILHKPNAVSVDGIGLDRFTPGHQYEVGNSLGALLLAEGWGEPVPLDEPALLIPFSEADPFLARVLDTKHPQKLVGEHTPRSTHRRGIAADTHKRKRSRR